MSEQTKVLVVDDNEDLLGTLALILKRRGFNVDTAEDGISAVNKFKQHHFDVILMDVVMPGMNGVEAFKKIREINSGARVILMTAYSEEELIKIALGKGAHCVVHKPLKIDKMIDMIKEAAIGPMVLIVDDDDDICQSMMKALELKGLQVLAAGSGEEAIKIARGKACQIAFVDIKLPLMNGLETFLKLKEINPGMLTIMMTGHRDEVNDIVEKAMAASAVTCLYKPFNPIKALDLISQLGEKTYDAGSENEEQREYISS